MNTITEQIVFDIQPITPEKIELREKSMSLINSIDFSMVKMKLMDEEEGEGWDKEYTDYVEQRYKRYLCMIFVSPETSSVPTGDIDIFWHQHILDTRAYAKDCEVIFGEFLHHFPYFGLRGEEDAQNLKNSFEETKLLYAQLFEEDYTTEYDNKSGTCHKNCSNSTCHKCAKGCSGITCKTCKSK